MPYSKGGFDRISDTAGHRLDYRVDPECKRDHEQ